jgi:hypothetical protein
MTYKNKPLSYWARVTRIPLHVLIYRYQHEYPDEIFLAPMKKTSERRSSYIADTLEAWSGLTPEQLETMREFERIAKNSKCE